jgi:hypothetical protein
MARRKTVREESRREVGTLDMAYYSTLSLLVDDDSIGMCLPCCESATKGGRELCDAKSEGGRDARGRGFYSPRRPAHAARRQVGLVCAPVPTRAGPVFLSPPSPTHPGEPGARGDVRARVMCPPRLGLSCLLRHPRGRGRPQAEAVPNACALRALAGRVPLLWG